MWTRISSRIGLFMAVMAGLFAVAALVVVLRIGRVVELAEHMGDTAIPRALLAISILDKVNQININALEYVTGETKERENFARARAALAADFAAVEGISGAHDEALDEIAGLLRTYSDDLEARVFARHDPELAVWAERRVAELTTNEAADVESLLHRLKDAAVGAGDLETVQLYLELLDEIGDVVRELNGHVWGLPDARKRFDRHVKDFAYFLSSLKTLETEPGTRAQLDEVEALFQSLRRGAAQVFEGHDPYSRDTALLAIEELEHLNLVPAGRLLDEFAEATRGEARDALDEMHALARSDRNLIVAMGAVVLALAGGITVLAQRSIATPIGELRGSMTALADGRLDAEIAHLGRRDEIGEMAGAVRVFKENAVARAKLAHSLEDKNRLLESLSQTLSKYLSPQIYEAIFRGERSAEIVTERKKLTVFFSDIKDFTATTDDLEPEDLTFLLNDYLTEMSGIALAHGATLDKFIGDAIVAFFGDPTTRGVREDALACVRMAVAMQRRMVALRAKWREMGYERPFHVRMGINTGFCNVGNFGSDDRVDYTIIGGEVNAAARLEQIAEPDGIVLAYETYALVREHIDADEGAPIHVKGIHREIRPFAVRGIEEGAGAESRFLRTHGDGLQVFVDLDKLDGDAREAAAKEIERIAARLRSG